MVTRKDGRIQTEFCLAKLCYRWQYSVNVFSCFDAFHARTYIQTKTNVNTRFTISRHVLLSNCFNSSSNSSIVYPKLGGKPILSSWILNLCSNWLQIRYRKTHTYCAWIRRSYNKPIPIPEMWLSCIIMLQNIYIYYNI